MIRLMGALVLGFWVHGICVPVKIVHGSGISIYPMSPYRVIFILRLKIFQFSDSHILSFHHPASRPNKRECKKSLELCKTL